MWIEFRRLSTEACLNVYTIQQHSSETETSYVFRHPFHILPPRFSEFEQLNFYSTQSHMKPYGFMMMSGDM